MMKTVALFLFTALTCKSLVSQCVPSSLRILDGTKVEAQHTNGSDHWNDFRQDYASEYGEYEIPANSGKMIGFSNIFWIGGKDPSGEVHVSAQYYRENGIDFSSGPVSSSGIYDCIAEVKTPEKIFRHGMLRLSGGKILLCYENGFSVYHPSTHSITHHTFPVPKQLYRAAELQDGRVFFVGDYALGTITQSLVMDTVSFTPVFACSLNFYHYLSVPLVLPSGKILITGLNGTELVDPLTFVSTIVANPAERRCRHQTLLLPSGEVLIAGGAKNVPGTSVASTTEIYNPVTNVWTPGPSMSVSRKDFALVPYSSTEAVIWGGNHSSFSIEKLNFSAMTITPAGTMPVWARVASGMEISSGEVMLVSSEAGWGHIYDYIHYYDPVSETVRPSSHVLQGRSFARISGDLILTETYDTMLAEFDAEKEVFPSSPWNKLWKVTQSEIDQFKTDFLMGAIDFYQYPDIETWPAHGDAAKGEPANIAPFVDYNPDGFYNPLDGDYPCIIGEASLFSIYRDNGLHTHTNGKPMGIDVAQLTYNHNCKAPGCTDTLIEYTTFYRYKITNRSSTDYHDVYMGFYIDPDIGASFNDGVGCDTSLNLGFAWNPGPLDSAYAIPPAFGTLFLETPDSLGMTNFTGIFNTTPYGPMFPDSAHEYYDLLRSVMKDGTHLVDNGNLGYAVMGSGPEVNFTMPGDAGFCSGSSSGWNHLTSPYGTTDVTYIQSVGPFNLPAGKSVSVDMAVVWALGSDYLHSVCRLKEIADYAEFWWRRQSFACLDLITRDADDPPALSSVLFPNPSSGSFTLQLAKSLAATLQLGVYDLSGKKVGSFTGMPGERDIQLDATALPQGVYLLRTDAGEVSVSEKMMVVR